MESEIGCIYNLNEPTASNTPIIPEDSSSLLVEFPDNQCEKSRFSKASLLPNGKKTKVMLCIASETGHVYAFSTAKLKPMIASEQGKSLIQKCLTKSDEQFTNHGAIKTEFTFEPPTSSLTGNTMPSNSRKRKMAFQDSETLFLPTMVPVNNSTATNQLFTTNTSSLSPPTNGGAEEEDSDEDEEDEEDQLNDTEDDEEENVEESESENIPINQDSIKKTTYQSKKRTKIESKSSTIGSSPSPQELQKTLKEALKAAADQRQRQNKHNAAFSTLHTNPLNSMFPTTSQQNLAQFNAILPFLQGISKKKSSLKTLSRTDSEKADDTSNLPTTQSKNSTVVYQVPQGLVYANTENFSVGNGENNRDSSPLPQINNKNVWNSKAGLNAAVVQNPIALLLNAAFAAAASTTTSPTSSSVPNATSKGNDTKVDSTTVDSAALQNLLQQVKKF